MSDKIHIFVYRESGVKFAATTKNRLKKQFIRTRNMKVLKCIDAPFTEKLFHECSVNRLMLIERTVMTTYKGSFSFVSICVADHEWDYMHMVTEMDTPEVVPFNDAIYPYTAFKSKYIDALDILKYVQFSHNRYEWLRGIEYDYAHLLICTSPDTMKG